MTFRSGFVCLVGRPNTGKSTLLNSLVGAKVAITSDKPQTTRSAVRGILDVESAQVVFVDTPGYHKPRNLLGERLNEVVRSVWADVEVCLFLIDAAAGVGRGDARVVRDISGIDTPLFCVVNKIDAARKPQVVEALARAAELAEFAEIVPVSARTGEGVDLLTKLIVERLPEGPMFYPTGTRSDQPPPVFVAELVREKLLARAREELPHSIAVTIEDYEEREEGLLWIQARVFVERPSQKGIVIGHGGSVLKAAGTEARAEIETLFGRRVYLDLQVKVEKDWQRRAYALDRLGLGGLGG